MSLARRMQQAAAGSAGAGPEPSGWTDPDLGNASYDSVSFSVAGQDVSPTSLFFRSDGLKLYVLGAEFDSVYEYDLSTGWDITTASFAQSFSVNSQDTSPTGLFFKSDGVKMYVMGAANDSVYEYDLSSAWDVSTASYIQGFSVSAQDLTPREMYFKPDGTEMYFVGLSDDEVHGYNLSTAWDISTASFVQSFSVAAQELTCTGLFFSPTGTAFFVMGVSGDDVNEYAMTTAWDISTASYVQNFSVASQETTPTGLFFKSDGSKMYVVGSQNDSIYQYSTVTPAAPSWTDPDIANASYDSVSFSVAGQEANTVGLFFKSDGTKVYIIGFTNDTVYQYSLSTAWDVSTASYDSKSLSVAAKDSAPRDLWFKPDGTEVYVVGTTSNSVHQYTLSTAWDVSSGTFTRSFSVSTQSSFTRGVTFKDDGTKLYVADTTADAVFQYSLSTAWDISTASYDSKSLSAGSSNPTAPRFNPDGTKMWLIDNTADDVRQYSLSTAWDVSTGSYDSVFFDVGGQEAYAQGLFFKSDGSKMYIIGNLNDTIFQYSTD